MWANCVLWDAASRNLIETTGSTGEGDLYGAFCYITYLLISATRDKNKLCISTLISFIFQGNSFHYHSNQVYFFIFRKLLFMYFLKIRLLTVKLHFLSFLWIARIWPTPISMIFFNCENQFIDFFILGLITILILSILCLTYLHPSI